MFTLLKGNTSVHNIALLQYLVKSFIFREVNTAVSISAPQNGTNTLNSLIRWLNLLMNCMCGRAEQAGVCGVLWAHVYWAITNHELRISYIEEVGGWFEVWEGRYNIWDAAPALLTRDGERDKSINLGRMQRDEQSCVTQDDVSGPQPPWSQQTAAMAGLRIDCKHDTLYCHMFRPGCKIIFRHLPQNYKGNVLQYVVTCSKRNKAYWHFNTASWHS
jgi:hypothetical protein